MAIELMEQHNTTIHPAPLVDWLSRNAKSDRGVVISQIAGIGGITLYALACCALMGLLPLGADLIPGDKDLTAVIFPTTVVLVGILCYLSTLLALHTIASSLLPLCVRLTLIFVVVYGCLRLATVVNGELIEAIHVVMLIPFCMGAFVMRRFRGWRSLAWNQEPTSLPMTILGLMDVTAAAALSLMVLTSAIRWADIELESMLSFVPACLFMVLFGMHGWLRLCALCPIGARAKSAKGLWFAISLLIAFVSFVGFLSFYSQSKLAFGALAAVPAGVLIAYGGTEIPIRWLRWCGWKFERFDKLKHLP